MNCSVDDCATAFRVLIPVGSGRPTADAKMLQKLYYSYALENHPDRSGTDESMEKGTRAYQVLKSVDFATREQALDKVFFVYKKRETVEVPLLWDIDSNLTLDEKEFQDFLKTLEGTDQIRFHRTFRAADGRLYNGLERQRAHYEFTTVSSGVKEFDSPAALVLLLTLLTTFACYLLILDTMRRARSR